MSTTLQLVYSPIAGQKLYYSINKLFYKWKYFKFNAYTIDKNIAAYYNVLQREAHNMTISLRLNDEDTTLIKKYAEMNNLSVSELIRQSVMERIENEHDLKLFNQAISEYKDNPVTYSLDEAERIIFD